ncbi:MAG: threonine synthase [Treponemataceae bacterium]|nr:threonine synthase [Treponemataceae bacterium]
MLYLDTRDKSVKVDFKSAVMGGMNAATGGLYVPENFPKIDLEKISGENSDFRKIAFEMILPYVEGEIPESDLRALIDDAYPFDPRLVKIDGSSYVLELFHGPTCAFKDFGARFMARAMSYFNRGEDGRLHILVATSGDTGSAVGSAFHNVEGLDVTILYPDGKISPLQEKQLSTFTGNVRALRVKGSFDDCQKLVKTAFTDSDLRKKFRLSSANSINISRLLPQSFYYMHAALQAKRENPEKKIIVVVPSGNFGNLTSGLIAREMGAPIEGFVAATNSNHTIPDWIATGKYEARPSVETFANAMDVGAPSNYERISNMYSLDDVRRLFASFWLDNDGIIEAIRDCEEKCSYTIDPHGAVAYKAWQDIMRGGLSKVSPEADISKPGLTPNVPDWADCAKDSVGIILETASPAKFGQTVKLATGKEPALPERLERVMHLPDNSVPMENDYAKFRAWLEENLR